VFIEIIERVGCLRARGPSGSPLEHIHSIPGTQYACSKRAETNDSIEQQQPAKSVPALQGIEVDFEIDKLSAEVFCETIPDVDFEIVE
jgi:hypothetical protein